VLGGKVRRQAGDRRRVEQRHHVHDLSELLPQPVDQHGAAQRVATLRAQKLSAIPKLTAGSASRQSASPMPSSPE
jgi:hypothetical protein